MQETPKLSMVIVPWTKEHDASQFTSNLASIQKYIQEQAHRDVSSYTSSVFVLTEPSGMLIRGYYSLSSLSILFNEMPEKVQKRLPRYPEASAILLGRLGIDQDYSQKLQKDLGSKPRLGELLLANAQIRCLNNSKDVGSALLAVDAEMPSTEEQKKGAIAPLPFYTKYGFVSLSANPPQGNKDNASNSRGIQNSGHLKLRAGQCAFVTARKGTASKGLRQED